MAENITESNGNEAPDGVDAHEQSRIEAQNALRKEIEVITQSDIGLEALLERLKQSLASARDFALFLKKRSAVEEDHAKSLKRLAKSTSEALHHIDVRQGTYLKQLDDAMRTHEKMADNGMQFALSLHQMHEDLTELTNNVERGRKTWKHQGLDSEKKFQDAEGQMHRAKNKYDGLADDYDRAKTGDVKGSRKFIKGPKSAAQYEEDVLKKLQAADSDYQDKVNIARAEFQDLINTNRPRAVQALQELINECDSALTLQLQKFATFNEKLLLGNGMLVTPLPSENAPNKSLRDIMTDIDNNKDFHTYVLSQRSKVPPKKPEIQYIKHPTLAPKQSIQPPATDNRSFSAPVPASTFTQNQPPVPQKDSPYAPPSPMRDNGANSYSSYRPDRSSSPQRANPSSAFPAEKAPISTPPPYPVNGADERPRQLSQPISMPYNNGPHSPSGPPAISTLPSSQAGPPSRPVFGVDLEELFHRDGSAVPMVLYQCMQAVDLFGLSVEGIYRQNGTAAHIAQLKAAFDHDASRIDFRNPASFHHDVNSVAGLLKQFLRDLPDPLLTRERYTELIQAARIDDDVVRRDTLHAVINGLPDANYATLRALILHLNRVQEQQAQNRMSTANLAICFAPSLMGVPHAGSLQDSGAQARVVDTILANTYQIFDED